MNNTILSKCTCYFGSNSLIIQTRQLSTTPFLNLIQAWRKQKGLPLNPNSQGPLTDKPDYTFLDGRPTPLGMRQKKRLDRQKEIALRIIQLSKELDHAKQRHQQMLKEKEDNKKQILANKLKPKGHLLIQDKN